MALHKIIVEPNNILIIIARLGIPKSPKSALLFCIKQKKRETLFGPSDSGVWKYHARMNEETIFSRCKLYMCVQYNMYTMYIYKKSERYIVFILLLEIFQTSNQG